MIFQIQFLERDLANGHHRLVARLPQEQASSLDSIQARVRAMPGTTTWPEAADGARILDQSGNVVDEWWWGESD
jgi:hypothetical protein